MYSNLMKVVATNKIDSGFSNELFDFHKTFSDTSNDATKWKAIENQNESPFINVVFFFVDRIKARSQTCFGG